MAKHNKKITPNGAVSHLPVVSEQVIRDVAAAAEQSTEALFAAMAASNPILYQFIYGIFQMPNSNKETMLGITVGMYHMLEKQLQIEAQNGKD